MSLSIYNIKKWYRMLTCKSLLHVKQDIGACFSTKEIKGYYNNLTRKVTQDINLLNSLQLPTTLTENGEKIFFPVQIFQYGLGSYDLYLQTKEKKYLERFNLCVEWTIQNQLDNGAWDNISFIYPDAPYCAICQGEGASLLLRAHILTKKSIYLQQAKKAIDFMLLPVEEGGTTQYKGNDLFLMEYTNSSMVLNGFIFALFGLVDIVFMDDSYKQYLQQAVNTLIKYLPQFDNGYWSLYSLDKKIASPFYHNLHIAQLQALYQLTNQDVFNNYAVRWEKYEKNYFKKSRAFIKKSFQKIMEK